MTSDPLALPAVPASAPDRHPVRDALLIALFAIALAVPMMGALLKHGVSSTAFENRPAAPWPGLGMWTTPGRAWVGKFEAAFTDRFGGRDHLIALHHWLSAVVLDASPAPHVLIGHDGWLYFLGEDGQSIDRDLRGTTPYAADEPAALAQELKRRHDFLAAQGVAYIVVIVPDKATIYPEHLPAWVHPGPGPTRLDRVYAALRAYPDVVALDLRPRLRAAKRQERLYFKTDSHWNYAGAIVGYAALMQAVRARVPAATQVPAERPPYVAGVDFYSGDLATMLGLPRWFREADIAPLGKILGDDSRRCARRIADAREPEVYGCARAGLPTAIVYRDSMAISLIPPLSENFRRVVYIAGHRMDAADLAREHPDVVIEEMVERAMAAPLATPLAARPASSR